MIEKRKAITKNEEGLQLAVTGRFLKTLTRKEVANALLKCDGFVMRAAKMLKCHYNSLHDFIQKDVILTELISDITEFRLDETESSLMNLIKRGNYNAIQFFLRCKGKHRGWVEDTTTAKLDKPIIFNYKQVGGTTQIGDTTNVQIIE